MIILYPVIEVGSKQIWRNLGALFFIRNFLFSERLTRPAGRVVVVTVNQYADPFKMPTPRLLAIATVMQMRRSDRRIDDVIRNGMQIPRMVGHVTTSRSRLFPRKLASFQMCAKIINVGCVRVRCRVGIFSDPDCVHVRCFGAKRL